MSQDHDNCKVYPQLNEHRNGKENEIETRDYRKVVSVTAAARPKPQNSQFKIFQFINFRAPKTSFYITPAYYINF